MRGRGPPQGWDQASGGGRLSASAQGPPPVPRCRIRALAGVSLEPQDFWSLSSSLEPDSWDRRLRSHRERLGLAGGPLGVRPRCMLLRMSLSAGPGGAADSFLSPLKM